MRRTNFDNSSWKPKKSDRVCSVHFVDNIPTVNNPDPSLHLGYEKKKDLPSRRTLLKHPLPSKAQIPDSEPIEENKVVEDDAITPFPCDHEYYCPSSKM